MEGMGAGIRKRTGNVCGIVCVQEAVSPLPCVSSMSPHVTPRVPVSGTLSFYCGVLGINCGKGLEKVLRWPEMYQKA